MRLTKWYPGHIKPVRVGVYQRKPSWSGDAVYSRWNGRFWCMLGESIEISAMQTTFSSFQNLKWRGAAK